LARACGAGRVIAVDTQPARRELALTLGADFALDPTPTAQIGAQVRDLTAGNGVSMVVEATGYGMATMPSVEDALGVGGKIILIGMNLHPIPISTVVLQMKAAEIHSALGHLGGGFEGAISLHAAKRIDMSQMITARFDLADAVAAIEQASTRLDAKIVIYPNPGRDGNSVPNDQILQTDRSSGT
jgi:threonine dehydrogenase-like Zn-dependent dehydrogenase